MSGKSTSCRDYLLGTSCAFFINAQLRIGCSPTLIYIFLRRIFDCTVQYDAEADHKFGITSFVLNDQGVYESQNFLPR